MLLTKICEPFYFPADSYVFHICQHIQYYCMSMTTSFCGQEQRTDKFLPPRSVMSCVCTCVSYKCWSVMCVMCLCESVYITARQAWSYAHLAPLIHPHAATISSAVERARERERDRGLFVYRLAGEQKKRTRSLQFRRPCVCLLYNFYILNPTPSLPPPPTVVGSA